MWIFTKDGLLMPAAVPMELAPKKLTKGYRSLQIRSRERKHLQAFIDEYMQGLDYSAIESTPDKDYEFRFYTTREAFAAAMSEAVKDVDYEKFKPEAKDHSYHLLLNRIWGVVYDDKRNSGTLSDKMWN
jgi:hypothetical protein